MDWIGWTLIVLALGGLGVWFIFRSAAANVDVEKLAADVKAGNALVKSLEDPKNGVITLREDGFTLSREQKVIAEIRWSDVCEIRAYKVDLFSVDLICWGFCVGDGNTMWEVHEHMAGFKALQKAAEATFGGMLEDWFWRVAVPAFEENMTVIWKQEGGKSRV